MTLFRIDSFATSTLVLLCCLSQLYPVKGRLQPLWMTNTARFNFKFRVAATAPVLHEPYTKSVKKETECFTPSNHISYIDFLLVDLGKYKYSTSRCVYDMFALILA